MYSQRVREWEKERERERERVRKHSCGYVYYSLTVYAHTYICMYTYVYILSNKNVCAIIYTYTLKHIYFQGHWVCENVFIPIHRSVFKLVSIYISALSLCSSVLACSYVLLSVCLNLSIRFVLISNNELFLVGYIGIILMSLAAFIKVSWYIKFSIFYEFNDAFMFSVSVNLMYISLQFFIGYVLNWSLSF